MRTTLLKRMLLINRFVTRMVRTVISKWFEWRLCIIHVCIGYIRCLFCLNVFALVSTNEMWWKQALFTSCIVINIWHTLETALVLLSKSFHFDQQFIFNLPFLVFLIKKSVPNLYSHSVVLWTVFDNFDGRILSKRFST